MAIINHISLHYCPVKREGESLKAMNDDGFRAIKGGVDLNGKIGFRASSGGNVPGAAHEHWQDAVRSTDG
ncbi:MAG: hypothetical protein ABIN99_04220, partial [Nitrosospira sp.]